MAESGVYLARYLAPLAGFLARAEVTDVYVNRPGEVWVETTSGQTEVHWVADLTDRVLHRLARQIAASSHQGVNREHPLLSASLPSGERVQIVLPPAALQGPALAIRRSAATSPRLHQLAKTGAFDGLSSSSAPERALMSERLRRLEAEGDYVGLFSQAVQARLNILISGGTSSGKTTLLNALIAEIPPHERLVTIEDAPELTLPHANSVRLIATRSALGEAAVSTDDLLNASLRLRPDRIFLGELRGPEALTFLRTLNTGHPGSMTTIHADSPQRAIEQIALLVSQAGGRLSREEVGGYVRSTIDLFIHLDRIGGKRRASAVVLQSNGLS